MGLAHLNIWVRNRNCDLLTDMWRTDLVIQACTGTYLVDMWPEIIAQLQARYPTYQVMSHFYQGAQRILLMPQPQPPAIYFNHIEVDVPPGCYKVWTRCCHGKNEETSVQMVMVRCGETGCVNLLLPEIKVCAAQLIHPLMDHILFRGAMPIVGDRLALFRGLMYGAELHKYEVFEQLQQRLTEAASSGDTALVARVNAVIDLAAQLPDDPLNAS